MHTFQKQFFPELLESNLSGEQASDPCEPCCCALSGWQWAILLGRRLAAVSKLTPLLLRLLRLMAAGAPGRLAAGPSGLRGSSTPAALATQAATTILLKRGSSAPSPALPCVYHTQSLQTASTMTPACSSSRLPCLRAAL